MVEDGSKILASVVASQLDVHEKYGGVVPELASRAHLRAIVPVVRSALEQAGTSYQELGAVAATQGPGLIGSLLVGLTFAKALSFARGIPFVGVDHLEAHIHAVSLEARARGEEIPLPALALVVSGGHTHLFEVHGPEDYRLLGRTRDDAAGEAYDKVAKLLGFPYPGGPIIDALAAYGNPNAIPFSLARMKGNPLDFSFSGLKTAVLRWVESHDLSAEIQARRQLRERVKRPTLEEWLQVTSQQTLDLLASFQKTVIEELLRRLELAAEQGGVRSIVISGGVAANRGLRRAAESGRLSFPVYFPSLALSTDNAAMVAALAFEKLKRGVSTPLTAKPYASFRMSPS